MDPHLDGLTAVVAIKGLDRIKCWLGWKWALVTGYKNCWMSERCGDPKCRGQLDHQGVCRRCGYDW